METRTCDIAEMLKRSMEEEKAAETDYAALTRLAENESARRELRGIIRQEQQHYDILQELYCDITGSEYEAKSSGTQMPQSLCEGLRESVLNELKTAESYAELACCLPCMRQKEKILAILNDEKCHARTLFGLFEDCQVREM